MTPAVHATAAPPALVLPMPAIVAAAASTSLRAVLTRPGRPARILAVFPAALYLELRGGGEPRVVALVAADAVRLPNSVVIGATARELPFGTVRDGDEAWVGENGVDITGRLPGGGAGPRREAPWRLRIRVRRWWEPTPALGPADHDTLAAQAGVLAGMVRAEGTCGLSGHPEPDRLAERCAAGDLAHAVDAAERIVGLGPGLTPAGDDVLAGLLVSMRLLGGVVPGGEPAVRLAGWIGAAVTADAGTRTTALAATLLHCAARGEAGAEVAGLLRALTGRSAMVPAVRRLLRAGHTSGSDLAWGVLAGCRATLALTAGQTA